MVFILGALLSVFFTAVISQSVHEVRWLPCLFIDEHVEIVEDLVHGQKINLTETKHQHRNAVLQFGQPEDSPVDAKLITFLVTTASKVDMRRYIRDRDGRDSLQCEVRRHRTNGTVRWPGLGAKEDDSWFICTLRYSKNVFVISTFLRHSPSVPNLMHPGFQWIPVADKDIISTAAVMMMISSTPSVVVALGKEQTLNCEFAIDHKAAHLTVEWHLLRHGHLSKLFSYSSHTGKSDGSGVSLKDIGRGNASLKIPQTSITSEGTYLCSVQVPPLSGSLNIPLNIMESPHVFLSVNSELSLAEGELHRVACEARDYYPLDVHMEWLKESLTPESTQTPEVLNTLGIVTFSSHRHNPDGSYSLSAYFLLGPTPQDSGYRYTCRVSHAAVKTPILKSFTLTVTRRDPYLWYLPPILAIFGILAMLLSKSSSVAKARKDDLSSGN